MTIFSSSLPFLRPQAGSPFARPLRALTFAFGVGVILGGVGESKAQIPALPAGGGPVIFSGGARGGGPSSAPFSLVAPTGPAGAREGWQEQSYAAGRTRITVAIPGDVARFGFVPLLTTTENRDEHETTWDLRYQVSTYGTQSALSHLRLTAEGLRTQERWVFVPTTGSGLINSRALGTNLGIQISVTGAGNGYLSFGGLGGSRSMGRNSMAPWAVSAALYYGVRQRIAATREPVPPGARGRIVGGAGMPAVPATQPVVYGDPNLAAIDFSQPLGDWRVWSPFVRVIIGAEEYAALPAANREALRSWVGLGGYLYLSPAGPTQPTEEVFGVGRIITLSGPVGEVTTNSTPLFTGPALREPTPAIPPAGHLALLRGGIADSVPAARHAGDWLMYFFIGFAIVIAPLNLYVFAPQRRRHWLFFTVPAISLAGVVILGAAIVSQDGLGGIGARRALVVLLPGSNQAAVFQDQVTRTGMLLQTSFPLADDTICAMMPVEDVNARPGDLPAYERANGQADGDWFRSRMRQAQHLRRLTPTRARVERVGQTPDGAPIVQSSVNVGLRDLLYVDAAGMLWSAPQVAPGARVTLVREPNRDAYFKQYKAFAAAASLHFSALVESAADHTRADRFIALIDDGELAPLPTLASIRWIDSRVMLAGIVTTPTTGGGRP